MGLLHVDGPPASSSLNAISSFVKPFKIIPYTQFCAPVAHYFYLLSHHPFNAVLHNVVFVVSKLDFHSRGLGE